MERLVRLIFQKRLQKLVNETENVDSLIFIERVKRKPKVMKDKFNHQEDTSTASESCSGDGIAQSFFNNSSVFFESNSSTDSDNSDDVDENSRLLS